jgi:uncharacterized protein
VQLGSDPLPHPLFWSIAKDGKTTYALGTMHLGVDAEAQLPKRIWDTVDHAKTFAMETDLTDPAISHLGERKSGSLHEDLGPEYWKKLERELPARLVDDKKPVIAATLLSMKGLPPTPPMDGALLAHARDHKAKVIYLETAAVEVAVLEKVMDIRTLKMLLDDPKQAEADAKEMLAAYVAGDEARIEKMATSQRDEALAHGFTAAEYDQLNEELLYARNAAWIPAIEKLHADGGGFIAVGALHLVGKRSVLDLLAKKGYTITRLEN